MQAESVLSDPAHLAGPSAGVLRPALMGVAKSVLTQAERLGMAVYHAELAGDGARLHDERRARILRLCDLIYKATHCSED